MKNIFIPSLICVFVISMASESYGQLKIEADLIKPIMHAISENKEIRMKTMSAEKTLYEKQGVNAKRLPHFSATGLYGFMHSNAELDLPAVTLPITGKELFDGVHKSSIKTQFGYAGVSAQQVIFSGMQIPNGIKALEEKHRAESYLVDADKESIAKDVIFTFDQLMLLKEVDKLIEDSERRLNKEHQKVLKAIDNGLAIPYDRDKLKLAMLELDEKKVEIQGNRNLLYSKLKQVTYLPIGELEKVGYELNIIAIDDLPHSVNERAELKALESSSKALEYVLKKEKGGNLPMAFAFGSANYINVFDTNVKLKDLPVLGTANLKSNHLRLAPNFMVGVGVKWNIFDGGEQKAKISQAKIDADINEQKYLDSQEKLSLLLEKNQIDYFTSSEKIKVARQQTQVAQNNLQLSSKRFEEGLIDMTELLAVENEFYKVNLNYFNQVMKQRQAAIELYHTSGLLLKEIL